MNGPHSEESKAKMAKTTKKASFSQYNWDYAEPYLDVELNNGTCSFQKNKRITLREFKRLVCEEGLGVREIGKIATKQQAGLFSKLCKGKIKLSKKDFEAEYLSGKSLDEIAESHDVNKDHIGLLRMLYQIDRKGPKFIHRKKTEKAITQRQREIIYGSLMGDAKKTSPSAVGFGQCIAQEEYINWKWEEMRGLRSEDSLKKYASFDKRVNKAHESIRFYTKANTDVENIITQTILNKITELGLAVWYMDDGCTDWRKTSKERNPQRLNREEVKICTDSFSYDSIETIVYWFKYKWGIDCHRRKRGDGWRVIVNADCIDKFFDLIRPHMIPSMMYKVDYQAYLDKQ
jgi:hypothetical protein